MSDRLSRRSAFARLAGLLGLLGAGAVVPTETVEALPTKREDIIQIMLDECDYCTVWGDKTQMVQLPHGWVRVTYTECKVQT